MFDEEFKREVGICKALLEGREPNPGPDTQEPQPPPMSASNEPDEDITHVYGQETNPVETAPIPFHVLASRRDGWLRSYI